MFNDRITKVAFLISLSGHLLLFGMPGINPRSFQIEKPEEITVRIEIEKPPLLPKIDIMGEEKKLPPEADPPSVEKEIEKKKNLTKIEPQPQKEKMIKESEPQLQEQIKLNPEPEPQKEKIVKKPEPEKKIEEKEIKQPYKEPLQETVKVINPQKEAMLRYQDMVKQKIESYRKYPNWAKKQGFEGAVCLKFVILYNGVCKDIKIIKPSGFNILDKEAVSTIKRAQPFPPIPPELKTSSLTMEVSIVFTLQ